MRIHGEVSGGDGDSVDESLVDGVNVELELGRNGDDRGLSSNSASNELENRLVMLLSSLLAHQVDLVLENDDLVELHDLNGGQMFGCLGLRARFVAGNEKQGGVHDGSARQHSAHENIVTGTIDETRKSC